MDHNVPISFLCVPIGKTVKAIFKVRNERNSHNVTGAYSLTYLQDGTILQRLISKLITWKSSSDVKLHQTAQITATMCSQT